MKISRGFVLMFVATAACGGGGSGDDGDDVIVDEPDAEVPDDEPDANEAPVCHTEASYGNATISEQVAEKGCIDGPCADLEDPDGVVGSGFLNAAEPFDIIQLELYKGFGVFGDQIVPGTYTLAGAELNYATCAICPRIFSDCTAEACAEQYFVTGGTVTITDIEPNLTFEVNDLTFVEVTIDEGTFESTPVPGGCSTSITSAAFDAEAPEPPPA